MKKLSLLAAVVAAGLVPEQARAGSVVEAVNAERARHGLAALTASPSLTRSADRFAHRLMRRGRFAHERRIRVQRARFSHVGEALALHLGADPGAAATVRAWMRSPPHRRLVLTRTMRHVGAGQAQGTFGGRAATIRVLHLATRQASKP